jgi:hypothetical protein
MTRKLVFVMIVAAACGKKDGGGDKGGGDKKSGGGTVDPGPANAAIPAAWKGKIEFEAATIADDFDKEGTVKAVIPKGWVGGKGIKAMREPPETAKDFGFGTHVWSGSGCGGECKERPATELEKEANKSFFDNLLAHTPPPKVIKDDKTPGHRLLVVEEDSSMKIMAAWWKDGGKRFQFCTVELAKEAKDLEPAFEAACNQQPAE